MKLASEAQISAAVEAFLPRAEVYRFPNVIGAPATHGVVYDFIPVVRDRLQRANILMDEFLAEITVDRRTRSEMERRNRKDFHHRENGRSS